MQNGCFRETVTESKQRFVLSVAKKTTHIRQISLSFFSSLRERQVRCWTLICKSTQRADRHSAPGVSTSERRFFSGGKKKKRKRKHRAELRQSLGASRFDKCFMLASQKPRTAAELKRSKQRRKLEKFSLLRRQSKVEPLATRSQLCGTSWTFLV